MESGLPARFPSTSPQPPPQPSQSSILQSFIRSLLPPQPSLKTDTLKSRKLQVAHSLTVKCLGTFTPLSPSKNISANKYGRIASRTRTLSVLLDSP